MSDQPEGTSSEGTRREGTRREGTGSEGTGSEGTRRTADAGDRAEGGVEVRLERDAGRFAAYLPGEQAPAGFLSFRTRGSVVDLRHTVVEPEAEGCGVGSALVRAALDTIRSEGMHLIPTCPFVQAHLKRHSEDADLVTTR